MFEAMDESSVSARQLLTQSGADPGGGPPADFPGQTDRLTDWRTKPLYACAGENKAYITLPSVYMWSLPPAANVFATEQKWEIATT